jgi:peptidoglycan/LPS O-acetylase OafA/YrhL
MMIEPWFDPNRWAWLPGTVLGSSIGLWGALTGALVPQRRGRAVVFGLGLLLAVLATASVAAGVTALATGQPFAVWFFLAVPILPFAILIPTVLLLLPRLYGREEAGHMADRPVH